MRRLTQVALIGVVILAVASIATAQQALQPVYRLGNFIEVGNDVFMHIIATTETRIGTVENRDFEKLVRDRVFGRDPDSTSSMNSDSDGVVFQNQIGAEFR